MKNPLGLDDSAGSYQRLGHSAHPCDRAAVAGINSAQIEGRVARPRRQVSFTMLSAQAGREQAESPNMHRYFRLAANPLTARETYQILRDIALGVRTMRRIGKQSWAEIYCGLMTVETDGWGLTFYNDCDALDYCDNCYSPDGRTYVFNSSQSYSTDPVELLSTWEHAQLEKLLSAS